MSHIHPYNEWISLHIYYHTDPHPLLVDGVLPLIRELQRCGTLQKYFYIRYWERGPHIRLRLLPETAERADVLRSDALSHLSQYLSDAPSMFQVARTFMPPYFKTVFIAEYGAVAWQEKYGDLGVIPYEANNSILVVDYEQEQKRYGGAAGMAIAQSHFMASTKFTLSALAGDNGAETTFRLGRGVQSFIFFCIIFLPKHRWQPFASQYALRWLRFLGRDETVLDQFAARYSRQKKNLEDELARCGSVIADLGLAGNVERDWVLSLITLRNDLGTAASQLEYPDEMDDIQRIEYLMGSWIHMHNNRLGLSALEEVYMASLLSRIWAERGDE